MGVSEKCLEYLRMLGHLVIRTSVDQINFVFTFLATGGDNVTTIPYAVHLNQIPTADYNVLWLIGVKRCRVASLLEIIHNILVADSSNEEITGGIYVGDEYILLHSLLRCNAFV